MVRKIIHIDMDCFFAAVEIRDQPQLLGQPVAVGGHASARGVISAASYEARAFRVHSALSTSEALRRCPDLVLIQPNFAKYKKASRQIYAIFSQYSDTIEPLSIDEAFLDVSAPKEKIFKTATLTAKAIREQIYTETGLRASAGIAPNPFLAKVASDWNKPNGQFTITPDMVESFVRDLSLRKIPGVGQVTEAKLKNMGYATCGDLQKLSKEHMMARFGKWGERLHWLCRGVDDRPIGLKRERKSISVEQTFRSDLASLDDCTRQLPSLIEELSKRLSKINPNKIKNLFVKLKFSDFQSTTVDDASFTQVDLDGFEALLTKAHGRSDNPVRLIGIGLRLREQTTGPVQLELF